MTASFDAVSDVIANLIEDPCHANHRDPGRRPPRIRQQGIGVTERNVVLRESLKALIEREAARRLVRLGGSDPTAAVSPRHRPVAAVPKRRPAR